MQEMVEQVHSVFCFGTVNWSWSQAILDTVEGFETKASRRSFIFKKSDVTLAGFCTRTARVARTI